MRRLSIFLLCFLLLAAFTITGKGYDDYEDITASDASFLGGASEYLGYSAKIVGDLNGDEIDDMIIGGWSNKLYIIFGKESAWTNDVAIANADVTITGEAGGYLGALRNSNGDINGDGLDDLLLYDCVNDEAGADFGQAYVVFGRESWPSNPGILDVASSSFLGEANDDNSSGVVKVIGDVNGDNHVDLLFGNEEANSEGGRAYLFFGSETAWVMDTSVADADVIFNTETVGGFDGCGRSAAALGDVNGDNIDDFAIGCPYFTVGGNERGKVYLFFGSEDAWSASINVSDADASYIGLADSDLLGWDLAGPGDVNNDGYNDILIGYYRFTSVGNTYIIHGKNAGWSTNVSISNSNASYLGESSGNISGQSVGGIGDINNDGYDDFAIYGRQSTAPNPSKLHIIYGYDLGWRNDFSLYYADKLYKTSVAGYMGLNIDGRGDVNNDGIEDLLIGDQAAGGYAGKVFLYLGEQSPSAPDFSLDLTIADGDYSPGSNVTLTSKITNTTQGGSKSASLNYEIPANLDYVSASISANKNSLLYSVSEDNARLYLLDSSDGTFLNQVLLHSSDSQTRYCYGLAQNPVNGKIYGVIQEEYNWEFQLFEIDPYSAHAVLKGSVNEVNSSNNIEVAAITFDEEGVLYALTSNSDGNFPETIFTVNTDTGIAAEFLDIGTGNGGDGLTYGDDGFLYRLAGSGYASLIFEKINIDTKDITNIGLSGDTDIDTVYGLSYKGNNEFWVSGETAITRDYAIMTINKSGAKSEGAFIYDYGMTGVLNYNYTPTVNCVNNSGDLNCSINDIIPAEDASVEITVNLVMEISDSAVPGTVVNNTITMTLNEFELSSGNNTDTASFTVAAAPSVEVDNVRITNIGLISNVPDLASMTYYFTSQTPYIQGVTEPNSTVHFVYGSTHYTTTAAADGKFAISISSPALPRGDVTLTYYAQVGGSTSVTRTLRLIIGEEYFPVDDSVEPTTSTTPTVTPTITAMPDTGEVTPTPVMPQVTKYIVKDENGNAIPNAVVVIGNQEYTTNSKGEIYIEGDVKGLSITITYNGKTIVGTVNGSEITTGSVATTSFNYTWVIILVVVVVGAGLFTLYYKKRKKKQS